MALTPSASQSARLAQRYAAGSSNSDISTELRRRLQLHVLHLGYLQADAG
jgi:hypothetical protein